MNLTLDNEVCVFFSNVVHVNVLLASDSFFYVSKLVATINCISSPVAAVGNGLVMLAILTTTSLHTPTNILIGSLALADFLIGAVVQPMFTAILIKKDLLLDCSYRDLLLIIGTLCTSSSVTLIAAVSSERFLALFLPLRYPVMVTNQRAVIVALATWILWCAIISCHLLNKVLFVVLCAIVWAISCFVVVFSYFKIFLLIRHHRRQIHSQQAAVQAATNPENASQTKVAITMGYIVGLSFLCLLPTPIIYKISLFSEHPGVILFNAFFVAMTIQLTSSSLNPVLYCLRLPDLRKATNDVIRKLRWSSPT